MFYEHEARLSYDLAPPKNTSRYQRTRKPNEKLGSRLGLSGILSTGNSNTSSYFMLRKPGKACATL